MAGARAEVTIDSPADEVWALLGDFGNLGWIPDAHSVQLDGDIRTFQLGDSIVKHRLLHHDDVARSYTYALAADVGADSDATLRATQATISVVPDGPLAARVAWTSETEERKGSSAGLGAFFQGILDHAKDQLQHA
jgi:hypothetical protein